MPTPKHIVAVAGLVSDPRGRVLMIRSPRRDWEFPGGQVEEGESLTDALRREVLEETGITVSVVYRVYTFGANEVHTEYTVYEERRI